MREPYRSISAHACMTSYAYDRLHESSSMTS